LYNVNIVSFDLSTDLRLMRMDNVQEWDGQECMYVCMSENLCPARLKRKRHSRAAVSNKQQR